MLILIILKLSLWVLNFTVKLWNAHFWTTGACSFTCYQQNLIYSSHLYEFVIWKLLKCTENWTGSPLLHLRPLGDLAVWKVANVKRTSHQGIGRWIHLQSQILPTKLQDYSISKRVVFDPCKHYTISIYTMLDIYVGQRDITKATSCCLHKSHHVRGKKHCIHICLIIGQQYLH